MIIDVGIGDNSDDERKLRTTVMVDTPTEIENRPDVEYVRHSLSIIWNLDAPERHFVRGYRLLPEVDFETIKRNEPFVARTGYYELFKALPAELEVKKGSDPNCSLICVAQLMGHSAWGMIR